MVQKQGSHNHKVDNFRLSLPSLKGKGITPAHEDLPVYPQIVHDPIFGCSVHYVKVVPK